MGIVGAEDSSPALFVVILRHGDHSETQEDPYLAMATASQTV
jgi:hypothetical protein